MRRLIVARTKMAGGRICVGDRIEDGESVRLMNQNCSSSLAQYSPYRIGEWWEVEFMPCGERRPPHVEDVAVTAAKRIEKISDVAACLLSIIKPWTGEIDCLFEGMIQFTRSGAGYISEAHIPSNAIGFWMPSRALSLEQDYRDRTGYYPEGDIRHLNYVGLEPPIRCIDPDRLVRVSLARWWKPENADPDFELRCYAQISGWY
jgi:hypothetical protein